MHPVTLQIHYGLDAFNLSTDDLPACYKYHYSDDALNKNLFKRLHLTLGYGAPSPDYVLTLFRNKRFEKALQLPPSDLQQMYQKQYKKCHWDPQSKKLSSFSPEKACFCF